MQDSIDLSDIRRDILNVSNCTNYKHPFLLPIGETLLSITINNDKVKHKFCEKMAAWNSHSTSYRGPNPKAGRSISQKLACLCTCLHRMNRLDGNGCMKCQWAYKDAIQKEQLYRPWFDDNMNCTCPICDCQFSIVYFC